MRVHRPKHYAQRPSADEAQTCASPIGLPSKAGMISSAKVRRCAIEAPGAANSTFSTPPASSRFSWATISSGRAEQRRVVDLERVGIVLDVVVPLGAGAAREVADVLQHLAARADRLLALLLLVDDLQAARHADHHRVVGAPDRLALLAEHPRRVR